MKIPKIKLSIIDIDGMFYHSCRQTSLEDSIQTFKEKLENCLIKTECTHWVGFTGKGKTFRNILFLEYKINRLKNKPIKYLKALKEWAIEEYNLNVCNGYESDDEVAYWYNNNIYFHPEESNFDTNNMCWDKIDENAQLVSDKIICSPDKDLLALKGKHFNYSYKLVDKDKPESVIKGYWVTTDRETSQLSFWYSMICGDTADGIKGIEGKGQAYADKIFSNTSTTEWFSTITLRAYTEKYGQSQGIYEFQKNYRLLHMLDCDEDFTREIGKLPQFPEIQSVNKQSVEQQIIPEF